MGEHAEEALQQLLDPQWGDGWLDEDDVPAMLQPRRQSVGYAAPELKPAAPEDFPLV